MPTASTKYSALCLTLLSACVSEEGCGPQYVGPAGGRFGVEHEGCDALVQIPAAALTKSEQVEAYCLDAPSAPPAGFVSASSTYGFEPLQLALDVPAHFTIQFDGRPAAQVAWRDSESTDWRILDASVTVTTSDGRDAVAFEHDRFGYYVVVAPR